MEKSKITWNKKYGCDNVLQNKTIQKQIKNTNMKIYNNEYPIQNKDILNKRIKTYIKNWGYDNPSKSQKIKDKKIENSNIKWGYDYPIQNKEVYKIHSSKSYCAKEYIFNTGEKVSVQGYEPFALDLLQKQGYCFEDIEIEGVQVEYFLYKKRVYNPDIYIPKENRIIEVKSIWTYELRLEENIQKQKASISDGFNFEFWFFDNNGNKLTL